MYVCVCVNVVASVVQRRRRCMLVIACLMQCSVVRHALIVYVSSSVVMVLVLFAVTMSSFTLHLRSQLRVLVGGVL